MLTRMAIFVLYVKAGRFVTKREVFLKKRSCIFTYFATMPIKNEKRGKNSQLFCFLDVQNFAAGTRTNMHIVRNFVPIYIMDMSTRSCCTCSKDLFYFFHISSYTSIPQHYLRRENTTVDVVHGVPLWSNEDVRGALCA